MADGDGDGICDDEDDGGDDGGTDGPYYVVDLENTGDTSLPPPPLPAP